MELLIRKLYKSHEFYKKGDNSYRGRIFDASLSLIGELEQFHIRASLSESLLMFGKEFAESVLQEDISGLTEEELTTLLFFTL